MQSYFNGHTHTMYSNIRLLDCINKPKDVIDTAIKLGLSGIAITDHECLSAHMEINQYAKEIKEKYPDFKIALGDEIYLVDYRDNRIKYYHFILIAKDAIGHKALREISSIAWYNLYVDRGMERVPITKHELSSIINKYKGHLIATTACAGGELSTLALNLVNARNNFEDTSIFKEKINTFINYCLELFGEDFYIECAPSTYSDQCKINKELYQISQHYGIKMTTATDAHYLTKKDRFVHKAYLNSKGGEREVDSFYEFTYLMDIEECKTLLLKSLPEEAIEQIFCNTREIQNKIQDYSLEHKQIIPKVKVISYPFIESYLTQYPVLSSLFISQNEQERYWVNECINAIKEKNVFNETYLSRLEIEADVIKTIGDKLDDCLFAYFNTFKHYIDLFWECGSILGPGRGSSTGFLSNYLLGITQLDPIRWNIKYWRFLNKERVELPDIDIDLAPSKRVAIFEAIRKERGELGLVQVATFGTEGTKSSILTACRGYRTEEYPEGIDVDEAQYMSSLIPQERGFLWDINDVVYGNEEKDRKPVTDFIREVNKYSGLLDIIKSIAGLVNKRSSHASGVILYDEDPYATAAFMRTPRGDLITAYDLHRAEAAGDTKYDFLLTEMCDKIIQCFKLLVEDKVIPNLGLRELYNKYLHPEVIDTDNPELWKHLAAGDIMDVFQFSTDVGLAIAKKLKPKNPKEMTAANAMMRLMSEKGKESQQDRYVRIQKYGLDVFEREMQQAQMDDEMRKKMHQYCDEYWGCCAIQEQMMELLMDVAGFTLGESNSARKVVAKKQMSKIPQLKEKVYSCFSNVNAANYFWENAIAPQLGYAFSYNHSLPYSFVGLQSILLATQFNPIYWDTACIIVNSGSLEDNSEEEIIDIYEPEAQDLSEGITFEDLPDKSGKIRKTNSTDYSKVAKAIGDARAQGIKVSLANINKSSFGFKPDVENNQILYGLKGMLNIGDELIQTIIANRPYESPKDFVNRVSPKKQSMISLIKGGAFDEMADRKFVMAWYLWTVCDKKSRLTLQNMPGLIKYNLLPLNTPEQKMAKRVYEFNRYLKAINKGNKTDFFKLDNRAINFLIEIGKENLIYNQEFLEQKVWDKQVYQKHIDVFRSWISNHKDETLQKMNDLIFMEEWKKYAGNGNISAWEMEVLCFYYHEHELKDVNKTKYGFTNFFSLPEDPMIEKSWKKGDKEIKIFKLSRLCGTCIAKNKTKSIVTILTTDGVVNVKFRKEVFALFDKQISQKNTDGTKKIIEKSWFNRGNMIAVTGMRSGDNFIIKKYAATPGASLYKIKEICSNGELILTDQRAQGELEEEEEGAI